MAPSATELAEYAGHLGVHPDSPLQPQQAQVDAAAADVPLVFRDTSKRDPYLPRSNPDPNSKIVNARGLAGALALRGHNSSVASWAIYRLIARGFLGAETAIIHLPNAPTSTQTDPTEMVREDIAAYQIPISTTPGPVYATRSMTADYRPDVPEPGVSYTTSTYLVVWPTNELWDWWSHSASAALAVTDAASTSGLKYSKARGPKEWANRFGVGVDTMKKMLDKGTVRNQKVTERRYRICVEDLPGE